MIPEEILVSIVCTSYNHEAFITNSIEGFLMQKTIFPIEIIIHDDASLDKTAEIIRDYTERNPETIFPILQKTNQYSTGIGVYKTHIWPRVRGKYIALCEGDDYWIDPYKLQKQIDFLEGNPDYGLCFSEFMTVDSSGNQIEKCDYFKKMKLQDNINGYYFAEYLENNFLIHPVTTVFRKSLLDLFPLFSPYSYDIWLFERVLFHTKIFKFKEVFAAYRNTNGSMTKSGKFEKIIHLAAYDNLKFFSNKLYLNGNKKKIKTAFFKRSLYLMGSPFLNKKEKLGLIKYVLKYLPNVVTLIKIIFTSKKLRKLL